MNDKIDIKPKFLPPFKRFCMTIGELPSAYVETMTYYEMLLWFTKYLSETVIPTINNNAEAVSEMQDLFVELQEYVNNYFDNLDVQEEINNKLDDMAEAGTLQEIIASYLDSKAIFCFDTESDLIGATNLLDGSYAKTLGKISVNDGFGSLYKITDTPISGLEYLTLTSGLYANLINSDKDNYYDEINYSYHRAYDTDYYITVIPMNDKTDEMIPISVDMDNSKTPIQYARANKTTLTINAGLTKLNSSDVWTQNAVIGNGIVLQPIQEDITLYEWYRYIGWKADRTFVDYPALTTSVEDMLADGITNAYLTFFRYVEDGELEEHTDASNWNQYAPRMDIGIKENGDIVILTCDGRTINNRGLNDEQASAIMIAQGCVKAFRTDGGGSTSLNIRGNKINRNIDDDATQDRSIHVTLNVKSKTRNVENAEIYDEMSKHIQMLNYQIRKDFVDMFASGYARIEDNSLNNIATADTYQLAKMTGRYRHNDVITGITDNDYVVGFNLNKGGLYRIVFIVNFNSLDAGNKTIRITKGENDDKDWLETIKIDTTESTYKQMICETVINNNTSTTMPVKFWIASNNVGDRFIRMTAYAEYLGLAETGS